MTQVAVKTLAQHDDLMKKTETMSILIESNKLLREEKEKAEQKLEQAQAKVSMQTCTLPILDTAQGPRRQPNVSTKFPLLSGAKDGIGHLAAAAGQLRAE